MSKQKLEKPETTVQVKQDSPSEKEKKVKIMEFPGENIAATVAEKVSDIVIAKMNINEEKRNREFTYQLKELEFYKSGYDKELRALFDYWTDLVWLAQLKDNELLSEQERKRYNKQFDDMIKVDKIAKNKINTIKYGGKETGRVLALQSKLQQAKYKDQPMLVMVYMWCSIIAVLKREILGQTISTIDIMQILITNLDESIDEIKKSQNYISKVYQETYGELPYWTE